MIKNRRIGCYLLVMTLFSLSSYWFLLKRSHQSDLYCSGVGSMRTIANNMIQMSSPVNSSSWHTTRRILLGAKRHNATVNCFLPGIFTPLYGNIKRMMSDIGITTALREYKVQDRPRFHLDRKLQPNRLHNYFVLETSFYAGIKKWGGTCRHAIVPCHRIILNSEPFHRHTSTYQSLVAYFTHCAESGVCVIWEYSSSNYENMMKHSFNNSVVLLPVMHQPVPTEIISPLPSPSPSSDPRPRQYPPHQIRNDTMSSPPDRLSHQSRHAFIPPSRQLRTSSHSSPAPTRTGSTLQGDHVLPLQHRPIDIVFYGTLTARRKHMLYMLQNELNRTMNYRNMSDRIIFTSGVTNITQRQHDYARTKICMLIHAFENISAGEYHRWSEVAPFGCVLLSEPIADVLGMEEYQRCGGLIVSSYRHMPRTVNIIMSSIQANVADWDAMQSRSHMWWMESLSWSKGILEHFVPPQIVSKTLFGVTIYHYEKL